MNDLTIKLLDTLTSILPSRAHILDVGCGNCEVSTILCEQGYNLTAFDLSIPYLSTALTATSTHGRLEIFEASLFEFKTSIAYDSVLFLSVLHYMKTKQESEEALNLLLSWCAHNALIGLSWISDKTNCGNANVHRPPFLEYAFVEHFFTSKRCTVELGISADVEHFNTSPPHSHTVHYLVVKKG